MSFASLNGHRAHDCALLARRWEALARRAGLEWRRIAVAGEFPVFAAASRVTRGTPEPAIYLSAGVHGDEAAAPWGLLEWGEENLDVLRAHSFLVFPCLNPHGIRWNTRADQRGVDLNRVFHDTRDPLVAAWRKMIGDRRIAIALCLHEDYDARGCYVYELASRPRGLGAKLLRDCASIIAPDPRRTIEGRAARDGLIRRRVPPDLPGLPEAVVLYQLGSPITFTFESPSEYSLLDRIAVQKRFIQSALKHELGI